MVWGCFAGDIRGPLVPLDGINTAVTYIDTVKEYLVPFIEFLAKKLPQELANDIMYQQDNSSIHTAKATGNWFEDTGIAVMARFPDMTHIEHVWRLLKAALYARFPDTVVIHGGPKMVRQEVSRRSQIVWDNLEPEVFDKLIVSMRRRCAALYNAKR